MVGMDGLRRRHPREQGDIGEAAAIYWLTLAGARVWTPLSHSPDVDLIAEFGEQVVRVQVKTSTRLVRDRFVVQLCNHGGNQSWNGLVKPFHPSRWDFLFALVADGRRWFIPSTAIESRRAISVGGPKWDDFEVSEDDPPEAARRLLEWVPAPGGAPELESRSGL
jgi:PD-(D/E)XK endonuclease